MLNCKAQISKVHLFFKIAILRSNFQDYIAIILHDPHMIDSLPHIVIAMAGQNNYANTFHSKTRGVGTMAMKRPMNLKYLR